MCISHRAHWCLSKSAVSHWSKSQWWWCDGLLDPLSPPPSEAIKIDHLRSCRHAAAHMRFTFRLLQPNHFPSLTPLGYTCLLRGEEEGQVVQNQSLYWLQYSCTPMCLILTPTIKVTFRRAFDESSSFTRSPTLNCKTDSGAARLRCPLLPYLSRPAEPTRRNTRQWKEMKTAFLHFKGGKTNLGEPSVAIPKRRLASVVVTWLKTRDPPTVLAYLSLFEFKGKVHL